MAKGRISKRVLQENKHIKFSEKYTYLAPPPDMHTYVCVSGGKQCLFFEKFGVLCFLVTSVVRFSLLLYYRRYVKKMMLRCQRSNEFFYLITIFSMKEFHNFDTAAH